MTILRGYVSGVERKLAHVRLRDGGIVRITNSRGYRGGENLVLMYDPMRDLITETYTSSEWDALQAGANLDETPGTEEEDDDDPTDCTPWIEEDGVFL